MTLVLFVLLAAAASAFVGWQVYRVLEQFNRIEEWQRKRAEDDRTALDAARTPGKEIDRG